MKRVGLGGAAWEPLASWVCSPVRRTGGWAPSERRKGGGFCPLSWLDAELAGRL